MNVCENCGSRVYSLGCTWCNEEAYIAQQEAETDRQIAEVSAMRSGAGMDRVAPTVTGDEHA
jgi:hypothetical protein